MITYHETKIFDDERFPLHDTIIPLTEKLYNEYLPVKNIVKSMTVRLRGLLMSEIDYFLDFFEQKGISVVYKASLNGTRFPKEAIRSSTYHFTAIIGLEYNENIETLVQNL